MVPEFRPQEPYPTPPTHCQSFLWLLLLAFVAPGPIASRASAQANVKGVWSKPYNIGDVPVHMIVAPCSQDTLHSQVFWWRDRVSHGLLKWGIPSPATDTVSRAFGTSPGGNYTTDTLESPTYNHFCGSHTRLADGRIFVAGGTAVNAFEVGIRNNSILDPTTRQYVTGDTLVMAQRRWYPTATTLRDGKILIHSGSEYFHVHLFGGSDTSGFRPDSLVRLAVTDSGMWDGDVTDPTSTNRPEARDLHSMVPNDFYSTTEYFGGRSASGAALNDVHFAYRGGGVNDADYAYSWTPITTQVDPNGPPDRPAGRYLAAATHLNGGDLVVFGGTASGSVFGDLWVLRRTGGPAPTPYTYTWCRAIQSGLSIPTARCGATLMRQEGVSPDTLLLFGGANGANAIPTDSTVYALTLSDSAGFCTAHWSAVTINSSPASNPGPRTQAAMLMDEAERYHTSAGDDQHRALLFGGRTETGALANDLWAFWMVDSAGSHFGEWQKIPTSGGPSARRRHAMALESRLDRLMLFGGETDLSGTRSDESWTLVMPGNYYYTGTATVPWSAYPSGSQKPLGHVSGLSADMYPGVTLARQGDIYDMKQSGGAGTRWTSLSSDPHLAEWYPQMFVVPDANAAHSHVFEAGPRWDSWLLDPDTTAGNRWRQVDSLAQNPAREFKGGTSVMYRVGKIMKVGSRDTESGHATNMTSTIDLGANPSHSPIDLHWQREDTMFYHRVNANVTLLPSGDVLITGGTDQIGNFSEAEEEEEDGGNFIFTPELWHPKTASVAAHWETLADDPYGMMRGYHSNAVLMPDGRVLVGSGNVDYQEDPDSSWDKVQVFSPPYLFDSSGNFATRIKILATGNGNLSWGDTTTVVTDLLADSLVLIRGSSATHAFNAEQRFVPLARRLDDRTVSEAGGTEHYYTIRIPSVADSVPPGDYLLFAVRSGYAPSIGRWLHINSVKPLYDVGDDVRPGRLTLGVDHGCGHDILNWTHPGDDSLFGVSGNVSSYDLRYTESATFCSTCWSAFNAADTYPPPSPGTPGTAGSLDLTGTVEVGHTYKFQMISVDDHRASPPWTSPLSAVVTFHVIGCDDGLYAGGGDGGDGLLARPTAALSAGSDTDPHASVPALHQGETSVLDGLAGGEARTERIALSTPPKNVGDAMRVQVRRGKTGSAILTGARLIAIDVPEGAEAAALSTRAFAGQVLPATKMLHQDRSDRTSQLGGDDDPYHGFAGDTLLISLPQAAGLAPSTPLPLVIRASGPPPPSAGVDGGFLVQVSNERGGWTTVDRHVPHDQFATFATDSVGGLFARVVLLTSLDISAIGRLAPAGQSASSQAKLASALHHSRLGALEQTALNDTSGVTVAARDTLLLDFPGDYSAPATGMIRSWVLELSGRDPNHVDAMSARSELEESLPTRFALEQNRPNPFSTITTFRFALPVASPVKVELYDLQGRHIHTLANGRYPAGWHSVTWDRALSRGGRAQAGVYLCRMSAGPFREVQKLIVSP